MFGSWKVSKKEKKNVKENYFLIFGFEMENTKENQIQLKLVRNLHIINIGQKLTYFQTI